ncbi:MAG: 50S ribosomal protein L18e [Nanoarchaeota archaeon]
MKSKTKIEKQMKRKTNLKLVKTIIQSKKHLEWVRVAEILASPNKIVKNLEDIEKESKEGDTIVIPGKVLSIGEISKKLRVVAFSFSKQAEEKLKEKKCEIVSILEEIKLNPNAKGIKILKGDF